MPRSPGSGGRPPAKFFTNDSDQPLLMTGRRSPQCNSMRFAEASSGSMETRLGTMTVPARTKMMFARDGSDLACDGASLQLGSMGRIPVTILFRSGLTLTAPFVIRTVASPGARGQAPGAGRSVG